jgi:hypothetical protein
VQSPKVAWSRASEPALPWTMLPILFGYLFEYVTRAVKLLANVHPGVAKMVTAARTKVNPIRPANGGARTDASS